MTELETAIFELHNLHKYMHDLNGLTPEMLAVKAQEVKDRASAWVADYAELVVFFAADTVAQMKYQEHSAKTFLEKHGRFDGPAKVS